MADILTQEEINALLSAPDGEAESQNHRPALLEVLAQCGVDDHDRTGFAGDLERLAADGGERKDLEKQALAALDRAIGGKGVSKRRRTALRKLARVQLGFEIRRKAQEAQAMAEQENRRKVMTYDFKHPARVNRDQLRTMENLHDNFARLASSRLSGNFRAVVDVDTAFVDQTTYAEFIMSLSNPALSYQFTLGPTNGQAILDIAMPVTFAAVDRACGGKGSSRGVEARQVTPIEIGEMNHLVKGLIEDLEATWAPIFPAHIHDIELETNPEFMQITAASEIVVLIAFEVNADDCSGLISLCYPFFTLESILPRLGQQSYVRMRRRNGDELRRQNRLRAGGMPLPVRAEVGRATIALGDARQLKAGDVLALDAQADQPAVVYVDDEPKFLGHACASRHGRHAVKVAGPIPAAQRQAYRNRGKPLAD